MTNSLDSGSRDDNVGDATVADVAEIVRNGEPINWKYWASRRGIPADQAAKLSYYIDPIKWSDWQYAQGDMPDDLVRKIVALRDWLAERRESWTLVDLAAALGEGFAPSTMRQALEPMIGGVLQQQAEEKREAGRYTQEEAAQLLASQTGEWADALLAKLMQAVQGGALPAYEPGSSKEADGVETTQANNVEVKFRTSSEQNKPAEHIIYLAKLHKQFPKATAPELLKLCKNRVGEEDSPFCLVNQELAHKGKTRGSEGAFKNWFTAAKKTAKTLT